MLLLAFFTWPNLSSCLGLLLLLSWSVEGGAAHASMSGTGLDDLSLRSGMSKTGSASSSLDDGIILLDGSAAGGSEDCVRGHSTSPNACGEKSYTRISVNRAKKLKNLISFHCETIANALLSSKETISTRRNIEAGFRACCLFLNYILLTSA